MTKRNPQARFWSKVAESGDCWIWMAQRTSNGYGRFWLDRPRVAHRVSYEWMVGPIPAGLELDHLCRNRACVNPYHMDPVTGAVNRSRAVRGARGSLVNCMNGHPYTAESFYLEQATGHRVCRPCRRAKEARKRQRQRVAA